MELLELLDTRISNTGVSFKKVSTQSPMNYHFAGVKLNQLFDWSHVPDKSGIHNVKVNSKLTGITFSENLKI